MGKIHKIMFVCLGNICRSIAAEGIMRTLLEKEAILDVEVDSCGLGDWHLGKPPDPRMVAAGKERGFLIQGKGKSFKPEYFDQFDLILSADREVLREIWKQARTPADKAKTHLLSSFCISYKEDDIPDPYHGGDPDFFTTLDALEDACQGIMRYIKTQNSE